MGIGGERGDNGDNSDGCSTGGGDSGGGGSSNGAYSSDGSGGYNTTGVNVTRTGIRSATGTISSTDEEINAVSRKAVTLDPRHSRTPGIWKLQKCLSTTTSHIEMDICPETANVLPMLYAQRSMEMRSYTPQAPLNTQSILINTRQYSSFGSIISTAPIVTLTIYALWTT